MQQKHSHKNELVELIKSFVFHYAFWFLLFAINRFIFIVYNHNDWTGIPVTEVFFSFVSALQLDLSMTSYFTSITFLLYFFYSIFRYQVLIQINNGFVYLFTFISVVLFTAEIPIYDEWHTKLSRKAILYLQNPSEVYNSATNTELISGTLLIFILCFTFIFFYNHFVKFKLSLTKFRWYVPVLGIIIIPFCLAVGIRGGLQEIPIQQSEAYYSKSNFLNLASVNSVWNLGQSFLENRYDDGTNPYKEFDDSTANKIVKDLFAVQKDTFPEILTTKKPNVVLVMLESWSADLLKSLGGFDSIAPNMENLISNGVEFTQLYSSGTLSDQGHCSILSAFPSQPGAVIMRQPDKFQKLPSIVSHFKNNGYYTAYYFGGQLEYGNIKGYVYYNLYDHIIEGKDFDTKLPKGKLGYHDEFLFGKVLHDVNTFKQPFFTTAFTMSSHSPFDYPGETKYFNWGDDENMYINGAHYADSCIGAFINTAKKEKWFDNTLFVFCSDHSHASPMKRNFHDPLSRKIVCFLYGNVIKPEYRGMKISKMGNHHDLANTLLSQLGGDVKPFVWSKNLLNPYTKDFGYSADDYILYFYEPNNAYTYWYSNKTFLFKNFASKADSLRMMRNGSAYLQVLYQQYLNY